MLDARQLKSDASQRDCYRVWDMSRGIGGGTDSSEYDAGSARVQAAFGFLFESNAALPILQLSPGPPSPPQNPRPAPQPPRLPAPRAAESKSNSNSNSRATPSPLFRRSSSPIIIESPPKKRKLSPPKIPRRPAEMAREAIELVSDDDEDWATARRRPQKGKGRATKSTTPAPVLTLDSDDDEVLIAIAAPAPGSAQRAPTSPPLDPAEAALATIISVIPDVLPSHVEMLIAAGETTDAIVEKLLGEGGKYPKAEDAKGTKRGWAEVEKVEEQKDWLDVKKRGTSDMHYRKKALEQLYLDYNEYATADIKKVFKSDEASYFYAPGWYKLREIKKAHKLTRINKPRPLKPADPDDRCTEFEQEMLWLADRIDKERKERRQRQKEEHAAEEKLKRATKLDEQAEKDGTAVECQCCFGSYHPENMTSCASSHPFCLTCALSNAKERLGNRLYTLPCLADCGAEFTESEARRFLPKATLELLHKIRMEKEVDEAGLEGLEKCPFCPYAAVIENPNERLFHCEREGCRKTSCRKCHELGHVPLTCDEAKKDKKLPGLHQVEEAMTAALIRRCPTCKTPCIKSDGCNVMTCSNCPGRTQFCYVCGVRAGHGSSHFAGVGTGIGGKCPQFDDTEARTFAEVEAARKKALADLGKDDVDASDAAKIAVVAPHRPAPNPAAQARYPPPPPAYDPYLNDPAGLFGALFAGNLHGAGYYGGGGGGNYGAGVAAAMNLAGGGGGRGGGNQLGRGAQAGPPPQTEAQRRARAAEAAARRAADAEREARRKRARGG
ncbi:hypothetical protein BCR35DRAFT_277479 [Leucosporidium creatinivorum]|uniref:RING-type domain-containing protein n=1 Tax=Leucosporidium creatinivorum TaxID=106004 RepID=A0A1Y2FRP0_9BASI|nr:hypothetical protein BCR35DRAFT_277479 [Leucosporidium creatinivorum]